MEMITLHCKDTNKPIIIRVGAIILMETLEDRNGKTYSSIGVIETPAIDVEESLDEIMNEIKKTRSEDIKAESEE